ncbi:LysR family transcriptional regulator [Nordella sp. HKS 07]|uniref:LysR family transcriptional regulator n=1 Tax=Nordella sp. HKS 07 TaxID=2712222 RepID=UPI0013E1986E|nr:LysR family transcriptional regulator [Nordella sp. HKS 07]QIG47393.1 LysR family transcriptional regulator [Nordella sp. HKS 07]
MRFSPSDLRALTVFRALVEHGGFLGTQLALGMSQSTVSFHLRALEERLGFELCRRGRKGFVLTERGRAVYEGSKALVASISAFEGILGDLHHKLVGTLRVGIVDNTITDPRLSLPNVLRQCMRNSPDVEIKLTVAIPEILMSQIATGGIDIAVTPSLDIVSGFDEMLFHEEIHSLYCGRLHPLFKGRPTVAQIEESEFVVRPYANNRELRHFRKARIRAHASNMEAQAAFILSGEFVGYLPEHYARQWVATGEMRTLMSPETRIVSPFAVITNSDTPTSPLQKLFIRELAAHGSLAREGRKPARTSPRRSKGAGVGGKAASNR